MKRKEDMEKGDSFLSLESSGPMCIWFGKGGCTLFLASRQESHGKGDSFLFYECCKRILNACEEKDPVPFSR